MKILTIYVLLGLITGFILKSLLVCLNRHLEVCKNLDGVIYTLIQNIHDTDVSLRLYLISIWVWPVILYCIGTFLVKFMIFITKKMLKS